MLKQKKISFFLLCIIIFTVAFISKFTLVTTSNVILTLLFLFLVPTIIPSDKPIEKQVIKDMADAILTKLDRYQSNCASAEVIDYYDAEIESKVKVGRKFTKMNLKVSDLSNDEYEKIPSCSWTKHLKNTASSVIAKNKSLIKLTHLVVATAVETGTYSEYGTF